MEVTFKMVGDVIAECFTTDSYISDNLAFFFLEDDEYLVEVLITLYEVTAETETESAQQGMQVLMWLCDTDSKRLNYVDMMSFTDLLVLCNKMQDSIDWGTIVPNQLDTGEVHLGVLRCLDITTRDLSCALNKDANSEFLRVLERLGTECDELFTAFKMLQYAGVTSFTDAKLLLGEVAGSA
jgi:hypothetical protein